MKLQLIFNKIELISYVINQSKGEKDEKNSDNPIGSIANGTNRFCRR